jgi:DNA polymerase-3 subunit delta
MAAKKTSSKIHFVAGNDEAEVKKTALDLSRRLAPDADAFGLEIVDGGVETVEAAGSRLRQTMDALATLPFLGGTKLVWLKSATFLADSVTGSSENTLSQVEKFCDFLEEGLPDGVSFLLSAVKPDKRRSAYKRLSKIANTTICDKPELGFGGGEEEIIDWTANEVRKRGLLISEPGIEVLASRVGLEPSRLRTELDKLETAFGTSQKIGPSEVRDLVSATRQSGIFDLGNAIQSRNLPLALTTLDQLFRQGEKGVGILLASIAPTIRNLLVAKSLLVRHKLRPPSDAKFFGSSLSKLPPEETSHLPRKKDGGINAYGLGLAAIGSSKYSLEELQRGIQDCAEANWRLVTSQSSDQTILTRLLAALMQENAHRIPKVA